VRRGWPSWPRSSSACTHPFRGSSSRAWSPLWPRRWSSRSCLLAHGGRPGALLGALRRGALTRPELIPLPALVLIDALLRRQTPRRTAAGLTVGALAALFSPFLLDRF